MKRKKTIFLIFSIVVLLFQGCDDSNPKSAFNTYIKSWEEQDFESMYKLLDEKSQEKYDKKTFIERYSNIYSGIEVSEVSVSADYSEKLEKENGYTLIPFTAKVETKAGEIKFTNDAKFAKEKDSDGKEEWKIGWDSTMIFSKLKDDEKIRINETRGYRGAIYDRNNNPLAISDQQGNREYPNGIASGHLTGYVRTITAEELEENKGNGYSETDLIGKTGLEKEFDDVLRPQNGAEIYVEDVEGKKKVVLAEKEVEDGKNLKLTIDIDVQNTLYNQMNGEAGAGIVMSPKDGQVIGLVSTPSYDPQSFVSGMSEEEWNGLNNDSDKPLTNRYASAYPPGSTFKTITSAIGLETGILDPDYDRNINDLKWQKSGWGNSYVTRAHGYDGASNLRNALVYSDNIYFAQVGIDIGATLFTEGVEKFGIGDVLDFDITVKDSQVANESISDEGQLAHTAYGQAEVLMNPLHMVSIYSFLVNEGDIVKPQLVLSDDYEVEYLKEDVCSKEHTNLIKNCLEEVISDPGGTAHSAQTSKVKLAGKTGTAEIKDSVDDQTGTETGWFIAVDSGDAKYLTGIMIENVKNRGGSGFIVPRVKNVFESLY